MAALTIVTGIATATGVLPSPLLILPFIASTTARRFGVVPTDASIDREGLWLGDTLVAPRAEILDVWADTEDTDKRVTVAVRPDALYVIHLPNAAQAERFADELAPSDPSHVVAGYRPRWIDALMPLRLLAVVASFIVNAGAKSPAAYLLLVFFVIGAYGFVVATQIDAGPDAVEFRSFRGVRRVPYGELTEAQREIPSRVIRGPLLTTSPSTKRAHARVLAHVESEMKKRRDA